MLAHGLAEGQHFIDGNKRVAAAAMVGFLELNGYALVVTEGVMAGWILGLSSDLTVVQLADEIRQCIAQTP